MLQNSTALKAQDMHDLADIASKDLNGTARYVSMGGALGALGGDISAMADNPAAGATFSKTDLSFTSSLNIGNTPGIFGNDKSRMSIDQVGIMLALPVEEYSIERINFGFNYSKQKNFFQNLDVYFDGMNNGSQSFDGANLINSILDYQSKYNEDVRLSLYEDLMFNCYDKNTNQGIIVEQTDEKGNPTNYLGIPADYGTFKKAIHGSQSQCDINSSFDIDNRFFFGINLGIYNIDYRSESEYFESSSPILSSIKQRNYSIYSWNETRGNGIDVKLGAIIRPIENSPFRFGLTIHTPTWYTLDKENGASAYLLKEYTPDMNFYKYRYNIRTPWVFGVSAGTSFVNLVAIGAEYQYSDLSTNKITSSDFLYRNEINEMNLFTKNFRTGQHTFKIGMEVKPAINFSIRCGYNYVSDGYKNDIFANDGSAQPYRDMSISSTQTETSYVNWGDINRFTFGLGYRFNGGYFDLAYQHSSQKGACYAFTNQLTDAIPENANHKFTQIKNNRDQIIATLGFRF